jgi:hypothetical protein
MYVFSRRAIQSCLDRLQGMLSIEQRRNLVHRLNQKGSQRFATVWETVLLSALSTLGEITHEQPLSDGRTPDVGFKYFSNEERIRVEIVSVSDAGAEEENPIAEFSDEVGLASLKAGVPSKGLQIQVGHAQSTNRRPTLLLPKGAAKERIFKAYVRPFLSEIKTRSLAKHQVVIDEPGVRVSIDYDRTRPFFTFGHIYFKAARSLHVNPLWNALKAKAKQLRSTDAAEMKGIFVCDAGCDLLSHTSGLDRVGADEIVRDFLRQNRSLGFVAIFSSTKVLGHPKDLRPGQYRISAKLWTSSSYSRARARFVQGFLKDIVTNLPTPVIDSANGAMRSKLSGDDFGNLGGFEMSLGGTRGWVRVPGRALLGLLSGKISPSDFTAPFMGGEGRPPLPNPFERAYGEGRMISRVRVEPAENENDDWITFEFGPADPLTSPFVVKQDEKG